MNNYKKVLSAVAGLSLASAAGMFAQEATPMADAEFSLPSGMTGADFFKQSVVQDLSWSVEAVYAMTQGDEEEFGTDLYGLRLGVAYQMDENKELTIALSYLTGTNDYYLYDFNVDRIELAGGFNYWFRNVANFLDLYVGAKIGFTETIYSDEDLDYNISQEIFQFVGGVRVGGVYKLSEKTSFNMELEYVQPLGCFNADWYEDNEMLNENQTYLMLSAGFEFKF